MWNAPLLGQRDLLLVGVVDSPGRAQERDAEDLLQQSDALSLGVGDVVAPAHVEDCPGLDPEELFAFGLVGEEADVLLDRQLLLADEGERLPWTRAVGTQSGDAVEVDDRPDELIDEVGVVGESLVGHASTE